MSVNHNSQYVMGLIDKSTLLLRYIKRSLGISLYGCNIRCPVWRRPLPKHRRRFTNGKCLNAPSCLYWSVFWLLPILILSSQRSMCQAILISLLSHHYPFANGLLILTSASVGISPWPHPGQYCAAVFSHHGSGPSPNPPCSGVFSAHSQASTAKNARIVD